MKKLLFPVAITLLLAVMAILYFIFSSNQINFDVNNSDSEKLHKLRIGFTHETLEGLLVIAKENGYSKLAVIAWVWVREYYKKRWYELEWEYMVKYL